MFGVCFDDVDLTAVVHDVDFVIGSGGRGFDFGAAAEIFVPEHLAGFWFDAGQPLFFAIEDVIMTLVEERSGDIGRDVFVGFGWHVLVVEAAAPGEGVLASVGSAEAALDGINGRAFGGAGEHVGAIAHGRGDEAPVADFGRVPCPPAPEFFSGGWVMTG